MDGFKHATGAICGMSINEVFLAFALLVATFEVSEFLLNRKVFLKFLFNNYLKQLFC